jgi:propionate CoA-transferase
VDRVRSISFSGERAIANGQRVLYVTERCVFELKAQGLTLTAVYPGIDKQRDILERLPFAVIDET